MDRTADIRRNYSARTLSADRHDTGSTGEKRIYAHRTYVGGNHYLHPVGLGIFGNGNSSEFRVRRERRKNTQGSQKRTPRTSPVLEKNDSDLFCGNRGGNNGSTYYSIKTTAFFFHPCSFPCFMKR